MQMTADAIFRALAAMDPALTTPQQKCVHEWKLTDILHDSPDSDGGIQYTFTCSLCGMVEDEETYDEETARALVIKRGAHYQKDYSTVDALLALAERLYLWVRIERQLMGPGYEIRTLRDASYAVADLRYHIILCKPENKVAALSEAICRSKGVWTE